MKALLLLSTQPGTGRTELAANLGVILAQDKAARVLLLDADPCPELALHFGQTLAPDLAWCLDKGDAWWDALAQGPKPGLRLARAPLSALADPAARGRLDACDWVLVDGACAQGEAWESALEAAGRGLLVERGDLGGARRALALARLLEARLFPRQGLMACFTQCDPSQPLPELQGLPVHALPAYPRATERLAQGLVACLADPGHAFSKALAQAAQALKALEAMPARPAAGQAAPSPALAPPLPGAPAPEGEAPRAGAAAPWEERTAALRGLLDGVLEDLDLKRVKLADLGAAGFRGAWEAKVRGAVQARLAGEQRPWMDRAERSAMERELCDQVLGFGPLEAPLADPGVTEIMVNRSDQVWLERGGRLALSGIRFWDDRQVLAVIERIVAPLGRRIDESSPKVDARLPDGSRVNAVIPPLAIHGPCLTIRKFPARRLAMDDLVRIGSLTPQAAAFLAAAVLWRKNLVVSGGTGSGKTTLLNILSASIPSGERIITVEDAAELKLAQEHVVSLEARPANLEGRGEVTIRELVANCLRMRPDRIVVGECRGGEALDMLQAMNTGHEGSLTTVHSNSPRDAVARLETLCLMAGLDLPQRVVRSQIAAAVDIIVQAARLRDGSRRVTHITEVLGMEGEAVTLQDIFVFRQTGLGEGGRVLGALEPTGLVPRCAQQAREAGLNADLSLFGVASSGGLF